MNAATEFDVGPLTWVRSEIDLALGRANEALATYTESVATGVGDLTQIRFARTHLHQVHGALTIVGLDGVTQVAEALEALLEAIEEQRTPASEAVVGLAQRALAALGHYLEDLIDGQPNQPLRLLSLYREVQAMRGIERTLASDLFFPDLAARPPRRAIPSRPIAPSEFQRLLKRERARFERGLLSWLRAPHEDGGACDMQAAVKRIEATQDAAAARSFWWVAAAFLAALADGSVPADPQAKRLCARIDLQIRRLAEGSKNVAERLLRDTLYCVANADSQDDAVRLVKHAYQLQSLIPSGETAAPAPKETVRRKLREVITSIEETWTKYCSGAAQALPTFQDQANALAAIVEQLGHTDYRRLAQAIAAAANWLAEDSSRYSEALSMEIATAILLALNAHENFLRLGGDFAHQVDVTVARIHGCLAGTPLPPGSEILLLDEMSRQAHEKLLVGQVAREIQSNLAQIEQVLDGFFRDVEKHADLASLDIPLRQVVGALSMMHHDDAVAAMRACTAEIQRFADSAYVPNETDFERVASQLSVLCFFIDSLPHGGGDFASFAQRMQSGLPDALASASAIDTDDTQAASTTSLSVEQELVAQKRAAHALLGALREQPDDAALREALKRSLVALQHDADLVADSTLGEHSKAMLSALAGGGDVRPQIDRVMQTLQPALPDAMRPTAQMIELSQASSEVIDAELLDIFLEEAGEVLQTIAENLRDLHHQTHNLELLTTIRRAFHTLKGSGRMVGLYEIGEAAWAVEQTLNLWLRQELAVSPPILSLVAQGHALFTAWVACLETHSGMTPDSAAMIALAEALRLGNEERPAVQSVLTGAEPAARETAAEMAEEAVGAAVEAAVVAAAEVEAAVDETANETVEEIDANLPEEIVGEVAYEVAYDADEADEADDEIAGESTGEMPEAWHSAEIISIDFAPLASPTDAENPPTPSSTELSAPTDAAADNQVQPPTPISATLYEIFSEEACHYVATLERELPLLEGDEQAPTPQAMYRAAHTLAGISATVGIAPMNRLGLALEHALLRRDFSPQAASSEGLGLIREAIGELALMLRTLGECQEPQAPQSIISALDALYPASLLSSQALADISLGSDALDTPPTPAGLATEPTSVAHDGPFLANIAVLHDEIDAQLLPVFLDEALDLCPAIASELRVWRNAPDSPDAVRTLTRLLHTLKGSARMAGAMNLGEITHAIETHVEQASRSGSAALSSIDEIDNAFDSVLQIVERLQSGESLAPNAVATPDAEHPADAQMLSAEHHDDALRTTDRADASDTPDAAEPGDALVARATLRVRADLIDRLVNEAGELSIARARIEGEMRSLKESLLDLTENVIRLRRQLREIEMHAESQMQSRSAGDDKHPQFDPLEFDRFTHFQELTRMMAESVNDVGTVQQHLLKNLDAANAAIVAQARLNREVQQELMAVRMVPFGSVADRLYRVVRQTAKQLDKRANLEIEGGQVEIDRSVLDKISAPLEHMLRNAIAHGIETCAIRQAKGKPDIGEITLALKREGNEIILSLSDDGRGLDFERIRQRALAVGLIGADEEPDTAHLGNLIFAPGFTTATEVSQIAGRGIGMDVVKTEVSSLGGRIEIVPDLARGSEFRLYIPLTLAVTKALLVRVGKKRYAIPSVMIEQVLDLKDEAMTRVREAGKAEWMGSHYPFHYLPHLLGELEARPEQRRQYWTLLLRSGTRRLALQVDELLGNREIVVKNIGPQLARVIGVDGATVLGDGAVVLILNPLTLSTRAPLLDPASACPGLPVPSDEEVALAKLPTVMVVDDSLTVRKITGRLLAREGYQVITAKDGIEALELLLDVVPDVMLVDIEMPRLDGFELTLNIRSDVRLKAIPIIMITSRSAEKHRNYAFEIGVNNYLGKPYQEDELLELVANFVRQRRIA